jgi:hypothetical protein
LHPFFEVSTLSDDELREKMNELNTRLYAATAMAMSFELRQQLQAYMEAIEQEMQTRFAVDMQKAWDAMFPAVIETEPDLKKDKLEKPSEKEQKKEGRKDRPANAPQFNKVYRK